MHLRPLICSICLKNGWEIIRAIDIKTKSHVVITNTLGESIFNRSLEIGKQNLSIQSQTDGIYFVKITDDKGLSTTKKIVVQK